jgi:DNA (cytosine-5)-methyltransferase 1
MLQPHELAVAMGFPRGYKFAGNKGEVVKQIGNAVAVNMARALCEAIIQAF